MKDTIPVWVKVVRRLFKILHSVSLRGLCDCARLDVS